MGRDAKDTVSSAKPKRTRRVGARRAIRDVPHAAHEESGVDRHDRACLRVNPQR
jgi:hypothetical protein